ncbi:hypothetical protein A1O1_07585 [Capronia coronata CBS 617.96]|uniref:Alcohol dehydrogenase n=1 Tax=Capronia coronata CBS 617.96 TaxID=1182541 RepID=W9XX19_9EURO|nr:uncharacterized protein A1O1_07585 [Capronia coronata CBS 617.96]EXJ81521.1 hypothetical protein A1O1_07585 [Capronia coronata CBS 617.96]
MTSVTHSEFDGKTDASTVATAFASGIKDRTIVITGVNKRGIGFATAQALASQSPRCLILTGRSATKVQECIDALSSEYPNIDYRLLQVDLSAQESVRKGASAVLGWADVPTIDLVINNAGVMNIPERKLSPEGIEMHLATNHMGHFLLTNLIMPKLITAAKNSPKASVRIVNVSSVATYLSALRASDMNFSKPTSELPEKEKPNAEFLRGGGLAADEHLSYIPMAAYGHSKTCNILFSVGLTQKLYDKYGILSLSLHPGETRSELSRTTDQDWLEKATKSRESQGFFWKTQPQAASTSLVAALDPKLDKPGSDGSGYWLNDCRFGRAPPYAVDEVDAQKLWELSEGFVGQKMDW